MQCKLLFYLHVVICRDTKALSLFETRPADTDVEETVQPPVLQERRQFFAFLSLGVIFIHIFCPFFL